jgi:hypothetical protein
MLPCDISIQEPESIASEHFVVLKDYDGNLLAIFDTWKELEYTNIVGDIDSCTFKISAMDERVPLFRLDYILEVYRSVPACGVDWYVDYKGFHRNGEYEIDPQGEEVFVSESFGTNYLLDGRVIGYKAGTIRADKHAPAETVMKEYVAENCGPHASTYTVVGRLTDGNYPGFSVDDSTGYGEVWSGSRAFENLLDVLKEIANFASIDFAVVRTVDNQYIFKTFPGQLGEDRTAVDLDYSTGLNPAGNSPVVFSINLGNVMTLKHRSIHANEVNAVFILGEGSGSTQTVTVVEDEVAQLASPWGKREVSRPGSNQEYEYQRIALGREILDEMKAKEEFHFQPLQQASSLYGKHYFLGDRVTLRSDEYEADLRLMEVRITASGSFETIDTVFSDRIKQ